MPKLKTRKTTPNLTKHTEVIPVNVTRSFLHKAEPLLFASDTLLLLVFFSVQLLRITRANRYTASRGQMALNKRIWGLQLCQHPADRGPIRCLLGQAGLVCNWKLLMFSVLKFPSDRTFCQMFCLALQHISEDTTTMEDTLWKEPFQQKGLI